MSATAKKDNPRLWEKVKEEVTAGDKGGKSGQWSARKAQLASHEYQTRGGGYVGHKGADNRLQQWSDSHPSEAGLTHLDKPALLALAGQHGVKGRSRMRKAELVTALKGKV